jgi:NAD(P)-dependent dehydrogenase (short-subunit alcohol dehydrogenase family)
MPRMADDAKFAIYPSLRERVVFITGGASGIGASLVEHFAMQGARVAFVDIADQAAEALADRLKAADAGETWFRHCDIRDVPVLQAAIADAAQVLGPIKVLVNNAGHDERHALADVTVEYWEERLQVNLRHQFFAAQAVIPIMQAAGGGAIVNFGSSSWHIGLGGMPAYVTAKAGIEGLTRGLARDLGVHNIRVNCVVPGWIMTERQIRLWLTPEGEVELMRKQCLKEKLYPPDIARMVLWLAADDSRMCTNQIFVVDGGWI